MKISVCLLIITITTIVFRRLDEILGWKCSCNSILNTCSVSPHMSGAVWWICVTFYMWNCCHFPKWWVGVWREQMGVSLDEEASHTHTHSLPVAFQRVTLLHSNSLFNNHDHVSVGPAMFWGPQHGFTRSNEEYGGSVEPQRLSGHYSTHLWCHR